MSHEKLRPLDIDLDEVVAAMDNVARDTLDFYLDTRTGRVRIIDRGEGDDESDSAGDESPEEADDEAQRLVRIPEADGRESYRLMQDFTALLPDPRLRERLGDAIVGRGAFRRFKDVLAAYPHERQRWF